MIVEYGRVPPMPYLIDGHNLIGKFSTSLLQEPDDEAWLLRALSRLGRHLRKQMTVFFDRGVPGRRRVSAAWVTAVFASGKADDAILAFLTRLPDKTNYTLVTSDRWLGEQAGRLGARVMTSEEFVRLAAHTGGTTEKPETSGQTLVEVEEWLEAFSRRRRKKG